MKTNESITAVSNRTSRHTYEGKFADFQAFGQSVKGGRYSTRETKSLTEYQNFLYKRARIGLNLYTPEELKKMHWQKRKRIAKTHKRTQNELNIWKQNKIITMTNKVFDLFFHSPNANTILDTFSEPDPEYVCKTSLKDLGIKKTDIITRLVEIGVLPHNFYTIKQ